MSTKQCETISCFNPATHIINPNTRPEYVCDDCNEYFMTCSECGVEFETDLMVFRPGSDIDLICKNCDGALK